MRTILSPKSSIHPYGRGFTMVECTISIVITGVMLVAVLQTVGISQLGQRSLVEQIRGQTLAGSLMSEIMLKDFEDPAGSSTLGIDVNETAGDRTSFDDVDDYANWNSSPPVDENNTMMSDLVGWQREVTVEWVSPDNPVNVSGSESPVKRITVDIRYNNRLIYSLTALRSAYGL